MGSVSGNHLQGAAWPAAGWQRSPRLGSWGGLPDQTAARSPLVWPSVSSWHSLSGWTTVRDDCGNWTGVHDADQECLSGGSSMQATSIVHATTLQNLHSCLTVKACGVKETVRGLRADLQPAPGQSSQVAMTPWDWSLPVGRTGAAAGASAPSGPRMRCTAGWRWLTPAHRDSFLL